MSVVNEIDIIKIVLFEVSLIMLYFIVWLPYLKRLKFKIWRTKGMINMIPIDIVVKND